MNNRNKKGFASIVAAVAAAAFAAGVSAHDMDSSTTAAVETDGFAPYIVGTLPFAAYELFSTAGYLIYDTEARVTSPLGAVVVDDSGEWSSGMGLTEFDTFNLRLEHEKFDVQEVDDANALWLAGAFRF